MLIITVPGKMHLVQKSKCQDYMSMSLSLFKTFIWWLKQEEQIHEGVLCLCATVEVTQPKTLQRFVLKHRLPCDVRQPVITQIAFKMHLWCKLPLSGDNYFFFAGISLLTLTCFQFVSTVLEFPFAFHGKSLTDFIALSASHCHVGSLSGCPFCQSN